MPLTEEEEKIFMQLKRRKMREYAKELRDRNRKRRYSPRPTHRKDKNQ